MRPRLRLYLVFFFFLLIGLAVLSRLFYWQVLSFEELAGAAEDQHFVSFEIPARRGRIFSTDGFSLVTNKEAYLLYASLPDLELSASNLANQLSFLLATPSAQLKTKEKLKERLSRNDLVWVPLEHKINRQTKKKIEALNLAGLGFEKETVRDYPEASSAAHLLGFVGADMTGRGQGYFGLEGFYDLQLRGRAGKIRQEKDALGRPILVGGFGEEKPEDGHDLVLFLDRAIQFAVEKKLKWGIEKYGAKAGSAVVMDPQTGAILAMASFPAYDPARFFQFEKRLYKNPVVADLFEPGSIIKPLIMAAALNEKAITTETLCDQCEGPRLIGGYTISTFNNQYFPQSTMSEIIEHSDNVGMVFVAEKLGLKKAHQYLERLGFGQKTNIDLQEETSGNLKSEKEWRPIDLATVSFGQGVALTRIQMITAFATLANGGSLFKPLVVKKIVDHQKEVEFKPEKIRQVFKPSVTKTLTEMLVLATEKSPLRFPKNRLSELNGYRIAAKSGTAQIPVAGHYDPKKTIASVIGFAPADEPKFVVMVNLTEPSAAPWGSDTAGPVFFEILKELFLYYGLQPGN